MPKIAPAPPQIKSTGIKEGINPSIKEHIKLTGI